MTRGVLGNVAAAGPSFVLIVTGSTLDAERLDRAPAYAVRARVQAALDRGPESATAVVCGDLWYLSQESLRSHPVVSVGPPERNALSAFLITRLPRVMSVDDEVALHLDLHGVERVACCWGAGVDGTERACGVFVERYLEEWARGKT